MSQEMIVWPAAAPVLFGLIMFLAPKKGRLLKGLLLLAGTAAALVFSALLFGKELTFSVPWMQWGTLAVDFSLRLYSFSAFIILAASALAFLISVYTVVFMKGQGASKPFFAYILLTLGFVNGAVLADNLILMLFFWEGLLAMLFAMIMAGGLKATATAMKALILNGVADLFLMLGAGLLIYSTGTAAMGGHVATEGNTAGTLSFIFMMTGAIGKAGAMPFHTWIPDAASDAPLPFMALLPGALEKLTGIYLLARISMDLFRFEAGSAMSLVMMIIGAATLIFAVLMALIQKNYKRLLSYHAVSQVGYMILGIGTALPIGIVGGLYHMINNAMYKSALFLTAGSVERATGTSDLAELGGLGRKMPVTFACYIVTAAAISGVPPFNGFFSKELIFGAALETNMVFYIIAVLGAFFTMASFLKLGHAAYLGKPRAGRDDVKEAPWPMLVPMIIIAAGCLLFGVWNALPLRGLIEPSLGASLHGESFAGHVDRVLSAVSVGVLLLALLNHIYGSRRTKSGLGAVDHIHYAPGMKQMYHAAERRWFDPYEIGMKIIRAFAWLLYFVDRGVNWIYDGLSLGAANAASLAIRRAHTGSHRLYISWIIGGIALIAVLIAVLA